MEQTVGPVSPGGLTWPGYQCRFCTRQFGDYLASAERFEKIGARVVFVYPGPGEGLESAYGLR